MILYLTDPAINLRTNGLEILINAYKNAIHKDDFLIRKNNKLENI